MLKFNKRILEQGVKYVQTPCSSVSIVNFEQVNAGWPTCLQARVTSESGFRIL